LFELVISVIYSHSFNLEIEAMSFLCQC